MQGKGAPSFVRDLNSVSVPQPHALPAGVNPPLQVLTASAVHVRASRSSCVQGTQDAVPASTPSASEKSILLPAAELTIRAINAVRVGIRAHAFSTFRFEISRLARQHLGARFAGSGLRVETSARDAFWWGRRAVNIAKSPLRL